MNDMERYLTRVGTFVEGCYVNMHFKSKNSDGENIIPGTACITIQEVMREAKYWAIERRTDVYLAMGAYGRHNGERLNRRLKALRKIENVTMARCLYMDIDVDLDPKKDAYRTIKEMEEGIEIFYQYTNIPRATIAVNSGRGGVHLYWPLCRLLTPNEWLPLANALANAGIAAKLKFDAACTRDITRLLRIPNTYNYKSGGNGLAVILREDQNVEDNPDDLWQILSAWQTKTPTINSWSAPDANAPPQDDMVDDLGGGIGTKFQPSDIMLVAKECPFIANTLANHGAGLAEPLWKHTISIACHTTDPDTNAHILSSGHHAYSPTETIEKLRQAQRDRLGRSTIGPPHCSTILASGANECQSCKHKDAGSNPISLGYGRNGHAILSQTNSQDPDLPFGYWRDKKTRHIYFNMLASAKNPPKPVCIFPFEILPNSAYLESDQPYKFTFTTVEAQKQKVIKVNQQAMSSKERAGQELGGQGLSVNYTDTTKAFFMGYLQKLHSQPVTMINLPAIGWHSNGVDMGFAFAGQYFTPAGVEKCRLLPQEVHAYGVMGHAKPWLDLASVVVTPERPDLSVLVAQGFAAPLVVVSGHAGYLLGAWSIDSGVGKSTALTLAQAVWGSPGAKNGLSDTEAHIFSKASTLKNIGIMFDEVKTISQQKNFLNLIFQITGGSEKGRADRAGNMKQKKEFNTLLAYATNASMIASVEEQSRGSYATVFRMFEFQSLENTALKHSPSEISRMVIKLNSNYGNIGVQYAKFLGENYDYVVRCVKYMQTRLEQRFKASQEERYWIAAIANTLAAAHIAKKIGVAKFNLTSMEDFLVVEFYRMRAKRLVSPTDYGNVNTVIGELGTFMKEHRSRNTVITDIMLMTTGRPPKGAVRVLNEEPGIKKDNVIIQISLKPLVIRISDSGLGRWCTARGVPKSNLVEALINKLGATKANARIASGTVYADMTEPCWTISVVGTPLEKEVEYATHYKP